jgi:hypothetical protein
VPSATPTASPAVNSFCYQAAVPYDAATSTGFTFNLLCPVNAALVGIAAAWYGPTAGSCLNSWPAAGAYMWDPGFLGDGTFFPACTTDFTALAQTVCLTSSWSAGSRQCTFYTTQPPANPCAASGINQTLYTLYLNVNFQCSQATPLPTPSTTASATVAASSLTSRSSTNTRLPSPPSSRTPSPSQSPSASPSVSS